MSRENREGTEAKKAKQRARRETAGKEAATAVDQTVESSERGQAARAEEAGRSEAPSDESPKRRRGFALLPKEIHRRWASLGGKAAQQEKAGHRFTSEKAREAGKRGGATVAKDREYMRELGRRGGIARAKARKAAQATQTETPADVDHTDDPSE